MPNPTHLDEMQLPFSGVLTPVITPFDDDLTPISGLLVQHCRWLLGHGVGLALFGTNSEGNSLSTQEKTDLLRFVVEDGIDPSRVMAGTGCCALSDSVSLSREAVQLGCGGVLMLPPFYYKDVSEDGLFASFAEVVERVGSDALRIYLYNIPPVANISISVSLVERLKSAYPEVIAGIKDSSGDWTYTRSMLDAGFDQFRVFVGSEAFLLQGMQHGGAGCISATANINPAAIVHLYESWRDESASRQQQALNTLRSIVADYPMIPALKASTAHFSKVDTWRNVRPPLVKLPLSSQRKLVDALDNVDFEMPGLSSADT